MRAARLLQILLILQNRGRTTATSLGVELEVTPRTILRDVDAMTEAGLPVIARQGNRGGIELGFNYRTRLTGLATDEAEALAVWLSQPPAEIAALGLQQAASRAREKLIESFPDKTRAVIALTESRFPATARETGPPDPRIAALAAAIRDGRLVRLRCRSARPLILRPTGLAHGPGGWHMRGAPSAPPIPQADWGDINISR